LYVHKTSRTFNLTIATAKALIESAEAHGARFTKPEIRAYFGEIDITWKSSNRLLSIIVFADATRPAVLYSQTDVGEILNRGETVEAKDGAALSRQLAWLLG